MSTNNGGSKEPVGYGHDSKGTAVADAVAQGRPHVNFAKSSANNANGKLISFTLDGREVEAPDGETIFRAARRSASSCRICAIRRSPAIGPTAIVASAWSRSKASGCWRQAASARPPRNEGQDANRSRQNGAAHGRSSFWSPTSRRTRSRMIRIPNSGRSADAPCACREPVPAPRSTGTRPQPSGNGGQSRRLHPVQFVRARLPRSPGQRRDRHGGSRLHREDRVRLRRSDGRLDLRRLRRMRAGLPDRRADAGNAAGRSQRAHRLSRPRSRTACVLIAGSAVSSPITSRTTSSPTSAAGTDRRIRIGCA